ncbi:MAG: hypothetical protein KDB14_21980, partial [Planctomycetales bacterium]|nr:hypothetical protein [Planctomycetales bacterium]
MPSTHSPGKRRLRLSFSLRLLMLAMTVLALAMSRWNAPRDVPSYWDVSTGENVLWSVPLGTQTYPSPVSHGGKVFI